MRYVDLNADLGEEITDDDGLLAVVSSANVACGYHAGSREIMRRVCDRAAANGVAVGAQVSYDDRPNFGRVAVDIERSRLREQVADQVGTLDAIARAAGIAVTYVKPHGALYHRVSDDDEQAAAVLEGAPGLPVLGLPGARMLVLADRPIFTEGFPDRGYTSQGRLVPRGEPGALVTDVAAVAENAVRLAAAVDSVCVHGDSPDAVTAARACRSALERAGFTVRRFA